MTKRLSKAAAHRAHMAQVHAKARAIVATGACPDCGSPLKRNLALHGWWQCVAYAGERFRAPEHRALPHCGFQTFTD